jgi:hypothetical protein
MRRNLLAPVSVLAAFYAFYILRGGGRALVAAMMGIPITRVMVHRVLPAFDVFSNAWEMAPSRLAILILAGPAATLLVGYLLVLVIGPKVERLPSPLLLFLCVCSYAGLILDPTYYAVIPLLRLGGEPETLAWVLGVSRFWIAFPAMAVLGLNVMLARTRLVPFMRRCQGT